jgi:RNA processing factor Prp31
LGSAALREDKMNKWTEAETSHETDKVDKAQAYENILSQLDEITRNFREFWEEYGPELTDEDMAEIHRMCRDLELRMLVKFCNRLEE